MNQEIKVEAKSVSKTLALTAAAAAAVVGVTLLVLPVTTEEAGLVMIAGHHGEYITWPYKYASELSGIGFEIVMKTNLQSSWEFAGNAVGTNIWFVPSNRPPVAFYTISKSYLLADTNVAIKQKGF